MTYPEHAVMVTFLEMSRALGVDTETGVLLAYIPDRTKPGGCRTHEIPGEHLDELLSRGWIRLEGEDVVEMTDAGFYWLEKWRREQEKAERRARRVGR